LLSLLSNGYEPEGREFESLRAHLRYPDKKNVCPSISRPLAQQVFRVFDGDSKVRAAKISEHREIYADHFSVAVEERSARTTGGGGGGVDNLVLKHVAMWPCVVVGRMRCCEASCDMMRLTSWVSLTFLGHIATGPGENAFNSCRIINQHNCISGHRGLRAIVQFEHCGVGRKRRVELKSREVRFRRNAIQFGAQTLRFSREVNFVGQNVGVGALIEELLQILVFPPRFDDVVISNDFPFALDDKAGTEDVNLKMRSRAASIELHHAFVVDQRLAGGIDGNLDGMARLLVEKFDDNMQQANAGTIILDDAFDDLALAFQKFQAILRVRS
jgi:hypothetical protein